MNQEATRERFGLKDGQFFAVNRKKNLQWVLNEEPFGFGDLRDEDIQRIQGDLSKGEIFKGFNEHHGTEFQQRKNPVVIIVADGHSFPDPIR